MDDEGSLVLHEASGVVVGLGSNHDPVGLRGEGLHRVHDPPAVLGSKVVGQLGVVFKDGESRLH